MMLKKFLLFLGLSQVALTARIYIDTVSCSDPAIFNAVKESITTARARSQRVVDALSPFADGTGNLDPRIEDKFYMFFGSRDREDVEIVRDKFGGILTLRYWNDNISPGQWASVRNSFDVEVHCNTDHIVPARHREQSVNYWDTVQDMPIHDGSNVLRLIQWHTRVQAVTSHNYGDNWPLRSPEVITFRKPKLERMVKNGGSQVKIQAEDVTRAANPKSLDWVGIKVPFLGGLFGQATQIDLLDNLENLMMHELTQTSAAEIADDFGYGSLKCLQLKDYENAGKC